jgi:hypothetical protein
VNFKRSFCRVQLAELRDEATNALLAERVSDRQRKLSLHAGSGHGPKIGARRTALAVWKVYCRDQPKAGRLRPAEAF